MRVSNCLDSDQDRHFVGPDLGPNYQRLSARKRTSTELDESMVNFVFYLVCCDLQPDCLISFVCLI